VGSSNKKYGGINASFSCKACAPGSYADVEGATLPLLPLQADDVARPLCRVIEQGDGEAQAGAAGGLGRGAEQLHLVVAPHLAARPGRAGAARRRRARLKMMKTLKPYNFNINPFNIFKIYN
jgi:hypothetical protein